MHFKIRYDIMQVKSWPLGSITVWSNVLKFTACRMSLIAVLVLTGCASVKAPETNVLKTPGAIETTTTGTTPVVPIAAEPVVPLKVLHLGLALGSGAARGFAHVGVIQVLEEAGIQPDLVVGTSAGSLVAALYASGKNSAQLRRSRIPSRPVPRRVAPGSSPCSFAAIGPCQAGSAHPVCPSARCLPLPRMGTKHTCLPDRARRS